ncbi:basic helix-loop-helix (bHLH) DNA-binding superfamily protein [Raphanus sativus]|uniref:Transcription factor bHLH126-like n=1 Tax=Raphanus sativus TaxID=3726 RepID=A0A6J0KRN4_RAPSA|nr:transcription factor bHLH126-like [Raphanus sativus]XP_056855031.1 transcription factor bHLH126-like [Raphanus sativus]KAJ4869341.1 basic helix-loop-helix (bHLH) DNA-binding superfamily protein [Raphanus sativus]KAJ4872808.1 basic helix-loop-helix (bHLH) DNA-binding superfamily protein [Raphanus sativus]
MDPNKNPYSKGYQRQRPFGSAGEGGSSGGSDMPHDIDDNNKKKKLLHRDIERQRRQEMAILYASLRSHLPLQYLKGKRAVADHVNAAADFIKDTETRIKELSARRDELSRETCQRSDPDLAGSGSELGKPEPASLIVQPCVNGFEVAVSSNSSGPDALPLSRVLEALQELGLQVINSLTTRVNERLMHTIQVEVNTFGCLDLAWLQQKLVEELIPSPGY